jgi:hypothetical protein
MRWESAFGSIWPFEMSLSKDFIEFIECLNAGGVEYLLVGGHALAFHGLPRFTKDIDFWIRPTEENAERVLAALEAFGFGGVGLTRSDFAAEGKIVQLGLPPNRIDLVTSITGVGFDDAYARRVEMSYQGNRLFVLHRDDLIQNKLATGREQDLLDVKKLIGT